MSVRSIVLGLALLGLGLPASCASADSQLPVNIAPDDSKIHYIGRFDTHEAAGPRCAWSNSSVALKFAGTALDAKLADSGENQWQIVVDGKPIKVLTTKGKGTIYHVVDGLSPGEHAVELVKRTEAFCGNTQFQGFQLSEGGRLLEPAIAKHRIEIIGDSISCGYGNEGKSETEHFSPSTENAYLTYGAIAARELGAECAIVAWSGRKMWPDNTMPAIYDLALPQDKNSTWNFKKWTPQVVLINLATNDFGKEIPEEKGWTEAYEAFLARVRKNYPDAEIYVASGSMMGDWDASKPLTRLKKYLAKIVADRKAAGDAKVHELDFAQQDRQNGLGSDWHPSIKTHEIMANKLVATLKHDLGW
jgi:lysophospholipase L1-like esterase